MKKLSGISMETTDVCYIPFDISFHSPPYTGRLLLTENRMKENEFELLVRRLNLKPEDGPFGSIREAVSHGGLVISSKIKDLQDIRDSLGCILLVVKNDLNNPLFSSLAKDLRSLF